MNAHIKLINQFFNCLNGGFETNLAKIATEDFNYKTNLGSNFDAKQTAELLTCSKYSATCYLDKINFISGDRYEVDATFEIFDISMKFDEKLFVKIDFLMDNNAVKSVHIKYQTNPEIIAILELIRAKTIKSSMAIVEKKTA